MLLRSAARVTRNVSDTCTSGVPWHPCVTRSSFFLPASARRHSCSLASSLFCVTWEKAAAPSNLWQRASLSQECLVKQKRSLSNCSRHSHLFPCSTCFPSSQSNTLLSFQKTLLRSPSFSSKPSSEEQPKVGIIARWFGFSGCKSCYHYSFPGTSRWWRTIGMSSSPSMWQHLLFGKFCLQCFNVVLPKKKLSSELQVWRILHHAQSGSWYCGLFRNDWHFTESARLYEVKSDNLNIERSVGALFWIALHFSVRSVGAMRW